jgi:heme exporter protein B
MPQADPTLSLHGVFRRFGYRWAVRDVSLEVAPGEAVLLVGGNGAGKTTLLRVVSGLLKASKGRVERHGAIGMVAHHTMMYDALTARENLRFFGRLHGTSDRTRIDSLLDRMGLLHVGNERIGTFSRGMLQRLAIARALLPEPHVLLLDEPLTGLDDAASHTVIEVLAELKASRAGMMIASHQLVELVGSADRVGYMVSGRIYDTLRACLAVAGKDLLVEQRTKTALFSSLVFAILVLTILYFARDATAVSDLDLAPGALWVTFTFAGMLGLNRAFLLERENRAVDGLRLSPATATAIFLGKVLGNLVFVGIVELVSLPLFILFYDVPIWRQLGLLLLVIFLATTGFVAVGTLFSAMVVRTRFSEVMLPVLLLPFLFPPIVAAVQLTRRIVALRPFDELTGWLSMLTAFVIIFFTLSLLLFEAILEE